METLDKLKIKKKKSIRENGHFRLKIILIALCIFISSQYTFANTNNWIEIYTGTIYTGDGTMNIRMNVKIQMSGAYLIFNVRNQYNDNYGNISVLYDPTYEYKVGLIHEGIVVDEILYSGSDIDVYRWINYANNHSFKVYRRSTNQLPNIAITNISQNKYFG